MGVLTTFQLLLFIVFWRSDFPNWRAEEICQSTLRSKLR